VRILYLQLT